MALADTYVVIDDTNQIVLALLNAGLSASMRTELRDEFNAKFGSGHGNAIVLAAQLTTYDSVNELIGKWLSTSMPWSILTAQPAGYETSVNARKIKERRAELRSIQQLDWINSPVFTMEHSGETPTLSAEDDATWAGYSVRLANAAAREDAKAKAAQLDSNLTSDAKYDILKTAFRLGAVSFYLDQKLEGSDGWNAARGQLKQTFYKAVQSNGLWTAVADATIGMTGTYTGDYASFEEWLLR